jgi:hypothetical protein
MLSQCNKLQDRVAVLDVFDGNVAREDDDVVLDFRNGIGINHLKYGAAYYPWIETTLSTDFGFEDVTLLDDSGETVDMADLVDDPSAINNVLSAISDINLLKTFSSNPLGSEDKSLKDSFYGLEDGQAGTNDELTHYASTLKQMIDQILNLPSSELKNELILNELKIKVNPSSALANIIRNLGVVDSSLGLGVVSIDSDYAVYGLTSGALYEGLEDASKHKKGKSALENLFNELVGVLLSIKNDSISIKESLDKVVYDTSALYNNLVNEIQKKSAMLPPSGSIAGVYAQVDANRGVWKAPANVSLSSTSSPWVKIDNQQQEDLNVDVMAGKSINAIRNFTGKGTLVWGARTLAGNDNEWRYISVRRFFNMVEKSVQLSTNWAVFEPNDVTTWVRVKAMIENYLTNLWKAGALAGATPEAAYFVNIGLGSTMSAVDILEGRMNVEIGMAAVRPAEFIILKFSHKLQES